MEVDVIIPYRGAAAFVEACLRSIGDSVKESINVIEDHDGRGFAHCCNKGMAKSKARWIMLMHSDCLVPKGWLDCFSAAYQASGGGEEVAALVPETCLAAEPFVVKDARKALLKAKKKFPFPDTPEGVARFALGLDEYAATRANHVTAERVHAIDSFCVLLSADAVARVGPFDESFSPAGSEIDEWFIRAQRLGYECYAARGAYVHHWEGATFKALGLDREAVLAEGRSRLAAAEDAFYATSLSSQTPQI